VTGASAHGRTAAPPWSTDADTGELELLVRELVDGAFEHRQSCGVCRNGDSCPALRAAIEAVLEWRDRRSLRSLVVGLRARQDMVDWQAA
jgi:hypothetical protein